MSNFIGSVLYRLQGNLFESRYYLSANDAAAATGALSEIITGMSLIQTADVEYVSARLTEAEGNHITHPVTPPVVNGTSDGRFTANSITFLEFVFFSVGEKGKTTHRIRGYNSSTVPALGVFNINTSGLGDQPNPANITVADAGYASYVGAVEARSTDQHYGPISASSRVAVGAKRATRRL